MTVKPSQKNYIFEKIISNETNRNCKKKKMFKNIDFQQTFQLVYLS